MSKLLSKTLILTLALGLLAPGEAAAQWRGYGYRGYGGYHGYHGGWGWGAPLAAGLIGGLALGALASGPAYGGGYSPYGYGYAPYRYGYPRYAYGYPRYGYGYPRYGYGYPAYGYRGPGLTRDSSCSDVRANPSLYSENVWQSCGVAGSGDWGGAVVR